MEFEKIKIFTDGASSGNPGPGGWGAIVIFPDSSQDLRFTLHVKELGGREEHTTNNRMELTAVIKALNFLSTLHSPLSTVVYSDSSYVINGITKWVFGWQKNGWVTATKNSVENQDLWQELFSLSKNFKIDWQRIGGHVGILGNERCDEIATDFSKNETPILFNGQLSDYSIKDILNVEKGETSLTKFSGRKLNKTKAYSYISLVDGEIKIHKTWAECEERVKGKKARFKKSLNKEDEDNIIKIFRADA